MRRILALVAVAAALVPAAPASAACATYHPGSTLVYRRIGDSHLVVYGPGSVSVTPTDCL